MGIDSCDVAIVGGGPAGCATAISLMTHAPSLSVVLIEASNYESFRVGESLPPPARSLLEHLGVWEAFASQPHRQTYGTTSSWGTDSLQPNEYFFFPANAGWHIDRVAFDALLSEEARRRGAGLLLNVRVHQAKRDAQKWRLKLASGRTIGAHFLVDATGTAALARDFGDHFVEEDHLIGIAQTFGGSNPDSRTLVEPFAHGWWYTAGLPDDRRVVVLMTDSDIARRIHFHEPAEWRRALSETRHVSALVGQSEPSANLNIKSASSRRLRRAAGDDWLAVGDSASRFDPLSSQGIFKALRSGIFGSYAIADLLVRRDRAGLQKYTRFIEAEFKSYLEIRARYYREERRWRNSKFWQRRHGDTFSEEPLRVAYHSSIWGTRSGLSPAPDNKLAAAGLDANHIPPV